MTFLKKSYSEYRKTCDLNTSYEGSDDKEELEIVPVDNKNNSINVVRNSDGDSNNDDFENNEENFFEEDINDQVMASPKTTFNTKVIQAMKKLQASYNDETN